MRPQDGVIAYVSTRFKRANHLECVRQRGPSNFLFESVLHLVKSCNHAQRALLAGRFQRQQISPGIGRIDLPLQEAFRFQ